MVLNPTGLPLVVSRECGLGSEPRTRPFRGASAGRNCVVSGLDLANAAADAEYPFARGPKLLVVLWNGRHLLLDAAPEGVLPRSADPDRAFAATAAPWLGSKAGRRPGEGSGLRSEKGIASFQAEQLCESVLSLASALAWVVSLRNRHEDRTSTLAGTPASLSSILLHGFADSECMHWRSTSRT